MVAARMSLPRPLLSAVVLAALIAITAVSLRQAHATAPSSLDAVMDAPSIPAPAMRVLALGFRSLIADLNYLQVIQIFGDRTYLEVSREERIRRSRVIARLLED